MSYSKVQLTSWGQAYLEDRYFSGLPLEFAKIELSSRFYTLAEVSTLTALDNVEQSESIRTISSGASPTDVEVEAFFSNANNQNGFTVGAVGIYALNPAYVEPPAEPEEPLTEPEEPLTEPKEPLTEPTEPSAEPTEPSAEPTEPSAEPTETPTEPTEPSAEPTETPTEPTEPSAEPTEPSAEPTETPTEPQYVLYGVALATENPLYITPPSANQFSLTLRLTIAVGEAEVINVNVSPSGIVTQRELRIIQEQLQTIRDTMIPPESMLEARINELEDVILEILMF